ncbi:MAG: hypothetical protein SFT81_05485 [Candidatus Caenarcaniphilales bacterium]|nr:hypothetical protein [Candidatus Caenarcaniphilales bacterium]
MKIEVYKMPKGYFKELKKKTPAELLEYSQSGFSFMNENKQWPDETLLIKSLSAASIALNKLRKTDNPEPENEILKLSFIANRALNHFFLGCIQFTNNVPGANRENLHEVFDNANLKEQTRIASRMKLFVKGIEESVKLSGERIEELLARAENEQLGILIKFAQFLQGSFIKNYQAMERQIFDKRDEQEMLEIKFPSDYLKNSFNYYRLREPKGIDAHIAYATSIAGFLLINQSRDLPREKIEEIAELFFSQASKARSLKQEPYHPDQIVYLNRNEMLVKELLLPKEQKARAYRLYNEVVKKFAAGSGLIECQDQIEEAYRLNPYSIALISLKKDLLIKYWECKIVESEQIQGGISSEYFRDPEIHALHTESIKLNETLLDITLYSDPEREGLMDSISLHQNEVNKHQRILILSKQKELANLLGSGEIKAALRVLDEIIKLDPEDHYPLYQIALILRSLQGEQL